MIRVIKRIFLAIIQHNKVIEGSKLAYAYSYLSVLSVYTRLAKQLFENESTYH